MTNENIYSCYYYYSDLQGRFGAPPQLFFGHAAAGVGLSSWNVNIIDPNKCLSDSAREFPN